MDLPHTLNVKANNRKLIHRTKSMMGHSTQIIQKREIN